MATLTGNYNQMIVSMSIEIGRIIQEHRERAALTQGELAAKLGISQQSVAKWESGKTSPRRQIFPALIEALSIDPKKLEVANWRSRWGSVADFPPSHAPNSSNSPSLDSSSSVSPPTINDLAQGFQERKSGIGYRTEFKSLLDPLFNKSGINGQWDVIVRGASTRWSVDYMTDKAVVNFAHVVSHTQLSGTLSTWARVTLWEMVTMRKMSNDPRKFVLIVTIPEDLSLDSDGERPSGTWPFPVNSTLLQRLTAEAAIMDIALFTARTPAQVVSLLAYDEDFDNQR